jgi:signal transduction histidine kinase
MMQQPEPVISTTPQDTTANQTGAEPAAASRIARAWAINMIALMLINLSIVAWHLVATGNASSFFSHQLLSPFLVVAYMVLGGVVVNKRPHNPIGWLFLVTGTSFALTSLAAGILIYGPDLPAPASSSIMAFATWLGMWAWLPAQVLPITFVLLLFPDGRLLSPRWRPIAWVAGLGLGMTMFAIALHPGPLEMWALGPNPFGVRGAEPMATVVLNVGTILLGIGVFGSLASVFIRYRRSTGTARAQMKWLAYAAFVILGLALVLVPVWIWRGFSGTVALEASIVITNLMILGIVTAAGVAIVSNRLYDIDVIINRTLVYGVMTGVVFFIYVLVVGGAGVLFQTQGSWLLALLATGLVAVLFQPLRDGLQRGVNRLLYGQRDEPFEVLAHLGQQLEQTIAPEAVYPTIVETVAAALRLPYVGLQEQTETGFTTVHAHGKPTTDPITLPLTYQGETVGRLVVARRSPGEALSEMDDRLLRNIAQQAGIAVYDAKLTADLQRSRQQLVTNREEERRRLRRDLHDGLGPSLASLLLEARVLRRMISQDPAAAEQLAEEMQRDIRATIEDIRRVVHELRPPALDDLGLVSALTVMAAKLDQLETVAGSGLAVTIDAADNLPPLPAAVEVAAYRIIQEALTNVVHHAHARRATVQLWIDEDLHIEVRDDGRGFTGGREGGVGLHSMRERAAELGGTWSIARQPGGGTLVRATLPIRGS